MAKLKNQVNEEIVGLKDLRLHMDKFINKVRKGESFIIVKRSRPIFRITPLGVENTWEEVVDFTKIKKGGIEINELLRRL